MPLRIRFTCAALVATTFSGSVFSGRTAGARILPFTYFNGGHLAAGARSYLPADGASNERGLAVGEFDHLYVVSRTGGNNVGILSYLTARDQGTVGLTGVSGGTFAVNQIRVADDGAIYIANLTTGATAADPFKIYRYADHAALQANNFTLAYSGVPMAGQRFGDTFNIRGSGADTQFIAGAGSGFNSVAVFTTTDGSNFSATGYALPGAANAGDAANGVAFGVGNTLYTKQVGDNLKLFSFTRDGTLNLLHDYPNGGASTTVGRVGPIAVDPVTGLLAGLSFSSDTTSHDSVRLYDISDTAFAPVEQTATVEQSVPSVATSLPNPEFAGAVELRADRLWVLDANNGISAYFIPSPEPAAPGLIALSALGLVARRRRL